MKTLATVLALWCLTPCAALARRTVLVELFTAQGCEACNKANASVAPLIDKPGVVLLTWSVEYWDYLGWKDTFAQPAFAERQRAYDTRLGLRDVSTPQIVVGGAVEGSGDRTDLDDLMRRARRRATSAPQIVLTSSGRVALGSGRRPKGGGEVWLVRYSPTEQVVEVKAGDNRGAAVAEHNVVRQLVRLGTWSGVPKTYVAPPPAEDGSSQSSLSRRRRADRSSQSQRRSRGGNWRMEGVSADRPAIPRAGGAVQKPEPRLSDRPTLTFSPFNPARERPN